MSAVFALANLAGVAAFAWPLVLSAPRTGEVHAHALDAPILVALLTPLLVLVAVDEGRRDGGDARLVALLGALTAVSAALRIPKGPTGEGFVFLLPILAGWSLGARFGFLLGAFSILVSSILTGGMGPWLPFQMFGVGWVGMGAGSLRAGLRGRFHVPALTAYAYASSIAYGFVITLWFWPFLRGHGAMLFTPGLGLARTAARYWRFYVLTSLPWDTGRALLVNAPAVAVLARPVGMILARARERLAPTIVRPDELRQPLVEAVVEDAALSP